MRDARDSSARRTIFGSRALPLSPLSDLIIFLVRFPLTHLLRSHPGTLAHLTIISLKTLSSRKEISKNELFNRDVRIALYPFPLRVDRYRRRDWLWRRHDVDGSLGGGQETNRRCALRQGEVLGGVETSFRLLR